MNQPVYTQAQHDWRALRAQQHALEDAYESIIINGHDPATWLRRAIHETREAKLQRRQLSEDAVLPPRVNAV